MGERQNAIMGVVHCIFSLFLVVLHMFIFSPNTNAIGGQCFTGSYRDSSDILFDPLVISIHSILRSHIFISQIVKYIFLCLKDVIHLFLCSTVF